MMIKLVNSTHIPIKALNLSEVRQRLDNFEPMQKGDSMIGIGIRDNELLVVDRSLEPRDNKVAVCYIDGKFTVKRLKVEKDRILLMSANKKFQPIEVTKENDFIVWKIVIKVL